MQKRTETLDESPDAAHTWKRHPLRPDDDHVLDHTWEWLSRLPKGVCPVHLPADYPRIANDLARLWPETAALDLYFEEKEFSPRKGRHGFPPLINEELLAIHVYYLCTRAGPDGSSAPPRMSLLCKRTVIPS